MLEFAYGFGQRIEGIVTPEQLAAITKELEVYCSNYDIAPKETSVSTYLEQLPEEFKRFMIAKKVAGRSSGTLKQYSYHLVPFFYAVGKPVQDITDSDIIVYMYTLQKNNPKIGNHSVEHVRLILSSFFSWCHDGGMITKNPMKLIAPVKYEQKEFPPISEEAFEEIRQAITDPRDRAIFEVMYSTGCRIAELCNLKLSDIDLKQREVHLLGKGNKHRTSYLSVRAVIAVRQYLKVRPKTEDDHLFLGRRKPHKPLSQSAIRLILKPFSSIMDVNGNLHPHRIRHQFATEWVNKGLPVTELQQILGHANLRTTQEYYQLSQARTKYDHMNYIA